MDSIVGITFRDWIGLLKKNHFNVSPNALLKLLGVTYFSILNSKAKKREKEKFHPEIEKTELIKDPVFILGHWRSGTTFLHNLICRDSQFGYTNIFECRNPHTFLTRQNIFELRKQSQAEARPTDNVQVDYTSPGEEEFPVAIISKMSPLLGWVFPQNEEYYEKFSTFSTVTEQEKETWKNSFHFYLQKLTYLYKKQLLLKSPLNTGRIKLLLELYPNAKFINIHRNPYVVFQSTLNMYKTAVAASAFQKRNWNNVDDSILNSYTTMYDAFFSQREMIPTGNYVDIAFEDLEADSFNTLKKIYSTLQLAGFEVIEEEFKTYMKSLKNYKKNKHIDLDENLKNRIRTEWERNFNEWGYSY